MISVERELDAFLSEAIDRAFPGAGGKAPGLVPTGNPEHGDFQSNAALALAKRVRRPPLDVATTILATAGALPFAAESAIAPPGFINLRLGAAETAAYLEGVDGDDRLAADTAATPERIVLDYSSPNVAKPMHIGHLRSTILGDALDRMLRFQGHDVVSDNHLGDWGTQFGILLVGYNDALDRSRYDADPVAELERVYAVTYARAREDPEVMDRARAELVALQQGDERRRRLWGEFVARSKAEFDRTYSRLGVRFDLERGESAYRDDLPGIVEELVSRGIARESEGAQVVFFDETGDAKLPPFIVRKQDGAYNYATTDLATLRYRVRRLEADRVVYVTDERQQLHFRQLFATARRLGWSTPTEHIWFGLMRLPEGTFSTREGNVIRLEKLLDAAEAKAFEAVSEVNPDLPKEEREEIARVVGLGAIRYADLSQNRQSTVVFTWEKALSLDGNTAPYLQYAYARIRSVLRKYEETVPGGSIERAPIRIGEPAEREVVRRLIRFPGALRRATEQRRPNMLTDYLFDLASAYNTFYQNVPFLRAPDGVRESRLRICRLVARTLKLGLSLVGVETLERM